MRNYNITIQTFIESDIIKKDTCFYGETIFFFNNLFYFIEYILMKTITFVKTFSSKFLLKNDRK